MCFLQINPGGKVGEEFLPQEESGRETHYCMFVTLTQLEEIKLLCVVHVVLPCTDIYHETQVKVLVRRAISRVNVRLLQFSSAHTEHSVCQSVHLSVGLYQVQLCVHLSTPLIPLLLTREVSGREEEGGYL